MKMRICNSLIPLIAMANDEKSLNYALESAVFEGVLKGRSKVEFFDFTLSVHDNGISLVFSGVEIISKIKGSREVESLGEVRVYIERYLKPMLGYYRLSRI